MFITNCHSILKEQPFKAVIPNEVRNPENAVSEICGSYRPYGTPNRNALVAQWQNLYRDSPSAAPNNCFLENFFVDF